MKNLSDKKLNASKCLEEARRPKHLTSGYKVGSKKNMITDDELFYYLNSCPFYQTYRDGELGEVESILLPLFRKLHMRRANNEKHSFSVWTKMFQERLIKSEIPKAEFNKVYKKLERYLINFYTIFHPSKRYEVILPYFPYKYDHIMGCSEAILQTNNGVRMYKYCFNEEGIKPEDVNYNGFLLQCAARVYYKQTGVAPTSMALVYPATKAVIYYSYNNNEKIEKFTKSDSNIRRYGSHCTTCTQDGCAPLIDKNDKYGWGLVR